MSILDYCRRNPCTGRADESIREATRRMQERGVGSLIVVDDAQRPIGMVTDRDVALRVIRRRLDPDAARLADVMQTEVSAVNADATVERAVRRLRTEGVRRIPVVDADGRLVGLFTADDAIQLVSSELAAVAEAVRAQFPADLAPERALPAHGG
jgi:CBS domain-containing protein